jgi:hypothetical protein
VLDELEEREWVRATFGLSNLRPFDGERAEKRYDDVCVGAASLGATELSEATEPVDDLRRPPNDMDSRLPLRGILDDDVELMTWRATREVELDEGDARTDCRCVIVFSVVLDASPFSRTPNSSMTGAGLFIDPDDPFPGALPGGLTLDPFAPDNGGGSLLICELLPGAPTDGDPAIVGSIRLRNDVSDCRCRELIVCEVARDDVAALLRVAAAEPFEVGVAFRFATR